MYTKRILIDLDGVLNEYTGNYNPDIIPPIKTGAKNFIKKLSKNNELYLFTSRNLLLTSKWIIKNKLGKYFKDVTNVKIPAYLYIDDRTICFNGDYKKILDEIENFKVYWKDNSVL